MPHHLKHLFGVLVIASFITACLAWLFYGIGKPLPWWGYPVVFGVFASWLYMIVRLLTSGDDSSDRVSSFDISIENQ